MTFTHIEGAVISIRVITVCGNSLLVLMEFPGLPYIEGAINNISAAPRLLASEERVGVGENGGAMCGGIGL